MSDFDTMLWRPINSGMNYNAFFPSSTCTKTAIGAGNTDFSIKEMNALVSKYAFQTELIAEILEKDTLQNTCNAIKDFVYNHFQYKADDEDQMLRSPACSWNDRAIGIDCKSYSILASCILTNLGIKHYIRKIKQAGYAPEQFTHVYVVVPTDQKTADLQKGSICIDGTLKQSNEPSFLLKNDLYMDLKHYALNGGIGFTPPPSSGMPGAGLDYTKILQAISQINLSSIKSWFKCMGSAAYDSGNLEENHAKINAYFSQILIELNKNLFEKNMPAFNQSVADLLGESKLMWDMYQATRNYPWSNGCTRDNYDNTVNFSAFYNLNVGGALKIYLNNYFTNTGSTSSNTYRGGELVNGPPNLINALYQETTHVEPVINWQPKAMVIPAFVITPYVANHRIDNPHSLNPTEVLKELVIEAANYKPGANSNPSNPSDPNNLNNPNLPNTPVQTAGFGIAGWLIIAAGIAYGAKSFSK